jgi:DNA-binding NarL/FixJ family response regulator
MADTRSSCGGRENMREPFCSATSPASPGGEAAWRSREEEVLRCMEDGMLYKEIEDRLHLTHSKLRKLQQRIFRKWHAQNSREAVRNWRHSQH